jgi:hypothetical protein
VQKNDLSFSIANRFLIYNDYPDTIEIDNLRNRKEGMFKKVSPNIDGVYRAVI